MRTAAGLLLLCTALMHGCAGVSLTMFGGAIATLRCAPADDADVRGGAVPGAGGDAQPNSGEGPSELQKEIGGQFVLIGVVLLVLFALQVGGGICLLTDHAPAFVVAVGVVGLASATYSIYNGDFELVSAVSAGASVLAILAVLVRRPAPPVGYSGLPPG